MSACANVLQTVEWYTWMTLGMFVGLALAELRGQ